MQIDLSQLQGTEMPSREPKEMFSERPMPDGRTELLINHSSYTLMSLCKRKAHYALNRGLVSYHENEATLFGRAIHGALETWYTSPRESRRKASAECDDSVALMESGQPPLSHGRCVRCAAQARFLEIASPLASLDPYEKRSRRNGTTILDAYFDHYADDPFVVLCDELGPIAERRVSLVLTDELDSRVTFFGSIDTVLKNESSGHIIITDHKTTSQLGQDFMQRIRPNWQYTGYTAAFQAQWPQFSTRTFCSNGILVAKTKQSFARQFTEIDNGLIAEWREALLDVVYDWWARRKMNGPFPMNTPEPCTQWGGCPYRTICETPSHLQESIIRAQFGEIEVKDAPAQ